MRRGMDVDWFSTISGRFVSKNEGICIVCGKKAAIELSYKCTTSMLQLSNTSNH